MKNAADRRRPLRRWLVFLKWAELSSPAIAALDKTRLVAVLPVAAVEQHGPHLPLGTDLFIAEGYIERIAPQVPREVDAVFLPVQAVGKSDEHITFAGTLTLSPATALTAWVELGESLARAGVRRLVLMNTHGGNVPVIDLVARTLRVKHRMLAVTCSMHRFGYPVGLFTDHERAHGIHGGEIETSLMLAYRPELVDMTHAGDFTPYSVAMESEFARLRANHPVGFGWLAEDLSADGAMGDARGATALKGEAAAEFGARAFVELLKDVANFDLERFDHHV
ncbi:creatininase family protein [Xanthobacter autotrophicus]|uniref:creatininase family protein n=1 Tax=Xanthobacter autotrophicus TaxID=280 RepID=UPI003D7FE32B